LKLFFGGRLMVQGPLPNQVNWQPTKQKKWKYPSIEVYITQWGISRLQVFHDCRWFRPLCWFLFFMCCATPFAK